MENTVHRWRSGTISTAITPWAPMVSITGNTPRAWPISNPLGPANCTRGNTTGVVKAKSRLPIRLIDTFP